MDYVEEEVIPRSSGLYGTAAASNNLVENEALASMGVPSSRYGSIYEQGGGGGGGGGKLGALFEGGTSCLTKKNLSYIFLVLFVIFSFIGVMEANNPNYLQPFLNEGMTWDSNPYSATQQQVPLPRKARGDANIPIDADGIEVPDEVVEGPREVLAVGTDGFKEDMKEYEDFTIQMFPGKYSYPQRHCVVFSNKNMATDGDTVHNRRICVKDATGGKPVVIDKTLMETTGLFSTEDGSEEDMRYITTGPEIWLILSIVKSKEPHVIKPQSTVNMQDGKDDVDGLVTSIRIRTGLHIIEQVVGKIEKKNLNRNCFLAYGRDPWANPSTKGLMFCMKWVTGDPTEIDIPEDMITSSGYTLSDYDGGVSYVLVGAGIESVTAYSKENMKGYSQDVKRNSVFKFEGSKKEEDMNKKIRSFRVSFGSGE